MKMWKSMFGGTREMSAIQSLPGLRETLPAPLEDYPLPRGTGEHTIQLFTLRFVVGCRKSTLKCSINAMDAVVKFLNQIKEK